MNSSEKEKIKKLDQSLIWHPFTQMKEYASEDPLIIERGEGSYLIDIDGKKYLDGVSSLWVTVHGHRKKELDEAIKNQIDKISHSTLLGLSNVPAVQLAEKLLAIVPQNLKKVFYSDSGSTSVEIAIKIAFQYFRNRPHPNPLLCKERGTSPTPSFVKRGENPPPLYEGGGRGEVEKLARKTKFVTLQNAYHGDTIGSVSVGGIDLFHSVYRPLLFDSYQIPSFDLQWAENLFKEKSEEIAALIVEPMIQGASGMLLQPKGFLTKLRELTKKYQILMIVDEVATGFGRTGTMFACDHEKIEPDILCVAKGITGGYLPLAATLTTQEIYDGFYADYSEFKTFFHGHTYTGNPLACAAAIANLEIFENEKTIDQLSSKIDLFKELLIPFQNHPQVREVRQLGMMVGIELIKDKAQKIEYPLEERIGHKVVLAARKRGAIIRPLGSVIVLMPPLSISYEELQRLIQIVFESMEDVVKN